MIVIYWITNGSCLMFSSHFWKPFSLASSWNCQGHAGCIKAVNFSQHAKAWLGFHGELGNT